MSINNTTEQDRCGADTSRALRARSVTADRLRAARERSGLSREQLAHLAHLARDRDIFGTTCKPVCRGTEAHYLSEIRRYESMSHRVYLARTEPGRTRVEDMHPYRRLLGLAQTVTGEATEDEVEAAIAHFLAEERADIKRRQAEAVERRGTAIAQYVIANATVEGDTLRRNLLTTFGLEDSSRVALSLLAELICSPSKRTPV